jgi:hypothetical protein
VFVDEVMGLTPVSSGSVLGESGGEKCGHLYAALMESLQVPVEVRVELTPGCRQEEFTSKEE